MKLTTPVWLIIDFALLLLLWAYVVAWPIASPDPGPRVELALVERGYGPRCDPDPPVPVTVAANGAVFVGWAAVGRDGPEPDLAPFVDAFERRCRSYGEGTDEDLPGGGKASKLDVLLRVDRRTSWRPVHAILVRIGAVGLFRVRFTVRWRDRWWNRSRTVLPAYLPGPFQGDVFVMCFRETFGPAAPDLPDLRRRAKAWFRENREREDVFLAVELQPHPDTPFEHVAHVLEVLLDLGVEQIDFLNENGERAVVVPR